MGLSFKKILDVVTDVIPLGTVVKTLGKGVGALLTKKVAKVTGIKVEDVEKVLVKTQQEIEGDQEIKRLLIADAKEERKHEIDFYGSFGELDTGSQKLRARVRPLLTFGLVGLIITYGIINLIHMIFPYVMGLEFATAPPEWLESMATVCVKFWFVGRTVEKGFKIWVDGRNGK